MISTRELTNRAETLPQAFARRERARELAGVTPPQLSPRKTENIGFGWGVCVGVGLAAAIILIMIMLIKTTAF